jgi:hypothetical protein
MDYQQSETLAALNKLLIERWEEGERKYGRHIDEMVVPTAITGETSWAQMSLNEMLDGVVYAQRALQEHERNLRIQNEAKRLLVSYKALAKEHEECHKTIERLKEENSAMQEFYEHQLKVQETVSDALRDEYGYSETIKSALKELLTTMGNLQTSVQVLSKLLNVECQ